MRTITLGLYFVLMLMELYRAWNILVKKKIAYYTGSNAIFYLLDIFGKQHLKNRLISNMTTREAQRSSGIIGLIVGIFLTVGFVLELTS